MDVGTACFHKRAVKYYKHLTQALLLQLTQYFAVNELELFVHEAAPHCTLYKDKALGLVL
jgi:hypothetical protein